MRPNKKQQKIAQEHRHIVPPLYPPALGYLDTPKVWPSFDPRLRSHHELFHACFPHAAFPAIFFAAIIGVIVFIALSQCCSIRTSEGAALLVRLERVVASCVCHTPGQRAGRDA